MELRNRLGPGAGSGACDGTHTKTINHTVWAERGIIHHPEFLRPAASHKVLFRNVTISPEMDGARNGVLDANVVIGAFRMTPFPQPLAT